MNAPVRVLLVEDDEDDHLITSELLEDVEGTDYVLTWVDAADLGIEMLKRNEHDVCLLDFRLGALTGLDVLEAVCGQGPTPPCILLTGQDDIRTDRAAAEAGAVDYLIKGQFSEADLERAVRYAVGNSAALRSLRESEQRFRTVFEAASNGIVLLDDDGLILTANGAADAMFGLELGELVGRNFHDMLDPDDASSVSERFADLAPQEEAHARRIEATGCRVDGTWFPIEFSVSSWVTEDHRFWSAIVRDVTEQRELLDRLEHEVFHDQLTGLANRAMLRRQIGEAAENFDLERSMPGLLLLDIDDFKRINDLEGHETGDQLLRLIGKRLQGCIRPGETVARLGGDEFALFVEGLGGPEAVLRLADRVTSKLREPFTVGPHFLSVTGSIGVAMVDRVDLDADELIRNADVAMYTAKGLGKNRTELFESRMHGQILERIALEDDLRRAIESGEITLHYQPLVDMKSGYTVGFEALARWEHRTRGWVPPLVFVEAAECSGMIAELGRLVLRRAVEQAALWQHLFVDADPISMSVNLSSEQLDDPGLVQFVAGLLESTGLVPDLLTLEITESVMVGDVEHAIKTLNELRELGVKLAMDDFGTGFSSLSYLRRLPVDILKLDRSFVVDAVDERGLALVEAVVGLSRGLGLTTVAEGIETEEQWKMLTGFGYDRGQGYFFARPLPAEEAGEHLRDRGRRATSLTGGVNVNI